MIQRKQTIFLILAIICFLASAMLPIGTLENATMGVPSTINCLGVVNGEDHSLTYPFMALPIIVLALNILHSLSIIFMYKNRKGQATNCMTQIIAIVVEYIACGVVIWYTCIDGTDFSFAPSFAPILPIIAAIFILLAHKGIMDDERLIRSIDRIR